MDIEKIPQEMRERRQWLMWYYDEDRNKVPIGESDNPRSWRGIGELKGDQIAFVLSADDPFTGIDLDDCITTDGLTPKAAEVIQRFKGIAYAEISPSGTGIKLTTLAKKPEGARCSTTPKWLECYDHLRFWTVTGNVIEGFEHIGDGQAAVDWLCNTYLPAPPPPVYVPTKRISSSLEQRAGAYVDNAELPAQGGRNNAAFRLAGHLAAIVGESGERLSETEILEFLQLWNSRLISPLSEKEISSVASSALKNGTPRSLKEPEVPVDEPHLDLNWSMLNVDAEDDEAFCAAMVPEAGLLRQAFDFYTAKAYRHSSVMGLAVAVSLCETIFGRRVRSHTDLRTNDYNLILATTGAGKEACESTITALLDASDPSGRSMLPPDVQSGNGLMKALSLAPCSIWVCDEFGKILQAMLDKKGNQHIKNIGNHLLKLYGKSSGTYGGAAHSDGVRNRIVQPHLCVLGLSTSSTVFEAVSTEQVSDGLIGRIAFWPVQDRPEPREDMGIAEPPQALVELVSNWVAWSPVSTGDFPLPQTVQMSQEAKKRWGQHAGEINERMKSESELRAAIWSRVAARTMKLALVHRAARIETNPAATHWDFVLVEKSDIEWAVSLSNWLARTSCGFIRENVYDKSGTKAKAIIAKVLETQLEVSKRDILRAYRSLTAGDLQAAADELGLETIKETTKGRPKILYRRRADAQKPSV